MAERVSSQVSIVTLMEFEALFKKLLTKAEPFLWAKQII
jgi:hypothetical protein